jgi:hypothetical protein
VDLHVVVETIRAGHRDVHARRAVHADGKPRGGDAGPERLEARMVEVPSVAECGRHGDRDQPERADLVDHGGRALRRLERHDADGAQPPRG